MEEVEVGDVGEVDVVGLKKTTSAGITSAATENQKKTPFLHYILNSAFLFQNIEFQIRSRLNERSSFPVFSCFLMREALTHLN